MVNEFLIDAYVVIMKLLANLELTMIMLPTTLTVTFIKFKDVTQVDQDILFQAYAKVLTIFMLAATTTAILNIIYYKLRV